MKVGLVLSQPPAYSETFFNSKIKGLHDCGLVVSLFVQQNPEAYSQCPVYLAPRVATGAFRRGLGFFKVVVGLLPYRKRVMSFIGMERTASRSWGQILKNLYTNAHLLKAELDWLHFGFATMALQSEHVAKAIGAQMAVSCRGFDMDVYPLKHPGCYELLWKEVDKVHVISNYMLQRAYRTGMKQSTPYAVISPAVRRPEDFHISMRNETTSFRILSVGRLHWIKGFGETLEALAIVKQQGYRFHYTIVGEGPEYANLKFAIHQLGLTKEVTLVGKLAHQETMALMNTNHLYLQYSHSEGFCNAVLEAQVAGCLCVVSDGGALPENILDGNTGWVVPKRQPKLLAETIVRVMNMGFNEQEMVLKNAYSRVVTQFNLEQQQIQFQKFYE